MPAEARDRLSRRVEAEPLYTPRRLHRTIGGLEILLDEPERVMTTTATATATATRVVVFGRGRFGTPIARGRGGSPAVGRENTPLVGTGRRGRLGRGGRGSNSVLPDWYPRRPLQDITAVVRAIERRGGSHLSRVEGLEIGSPIVPLDHIVHTPRIIRSVAQLELGFSHTPRPTIGKRLCPPSTVGKVPKILLDITNQNSSAEESEFLTPQKRLLNSIDTVEKEVMEELRKLKRTPTAKKAEREKRVRTLMSMR